MCGRYVLTASEEQLRALFGYIDAAEPFPPRHNIAPTQPIAVIRAMHHRTELALVRWGLVPAWVKDPKGFTLIINARSEEIAEKPAFKNAVRYRRCLVPASGFYEWRRGPGKAKQPYFIPPAAGGVIAFAGLWETWSDRDGGEIDSGAIITTAANAELGPIHDRMPVVIAPADWATWLSGSTEEALALLRPAADGFFAPYQVSDRVNKAAADDAGLIAPVTEMKADLFG